MQGSFVQFHNLVLCAKFLKNLVLLVINLAIFLAITKVLNYIWLQSTAIFLQQEGN